MKPDWELTRFWPGNAFPREVEALQLHRQCELPAQSPDGGSVSKPR